MRQTRKEQLKRSGHRGCTEYLCFAAMSTLCSDLNRVVEQVWWLKDVWPLPLLIRHADYADLLGTFVGGGLSVLSQLSWFDSPLC